MTKKENSHRQRISHDFGRARGFCCCCCGDAMACRLNERFLMMVFCFVFFSCRLGWEGELCTMCSPYPGCKHGYCVDQPWQCICNVNWGGILCDQGKAYLRRDSLYPSTVHCLSLSTRCSITSHATPVSSKRANNFLRAIHRRARFLTGLLIN
jgi:hypothetical protein